MKNVDKKKAKKLRILQKKSQRRGKQAKKAEKTKKMRVSGNQVIRLWVSGYLNIRAITRYGGASRHRTKSFFCDFCAFLRPFSFTIYNLLFMIVSISLDPSCSFVVR
jgi:hypothetical protein